VEKEKTEIAALVKRVADLCQAVSVCEQSRETLSRQIVEKKEKQQKVKEMLTPVREALNQTIIAKTSAQTESNSLLEYAGRELSINLSEHRSDELPQDLDLTKTDSEIAELKKRMEHLGNVNMDAIEELEAVSASLQHITAQEKDLVEAKEKLTNVMRKIDDKCRTRLLEVFDAIRQNFHEVFRRLFGGGRADVFFEEGKDILEAGIEIVAKPPGKDLISISLLSGGEKALTTIALLFAIFKSNPSPFCILDEIDAPLDDVNTGKFLSLVREFLSQSQFLIITHSQQTMEAADILYGITMQEPGVSTKISYTLKEALTCDERTQKSEPACAEKEPELVASTAKAEA
jgi:chromosome segregation protein